MKVIVILFFSMLLFAQCPNQNSTKELELKEKELALKEKELELKVKETIAEKDADEKKEKAESEKKAEPETEKKKKAEPPKKKKPTGSKGCGLTNRIQFKKGTSASTFKCELDTNTGNTKHRYLLKAEAGQDLTISFNSTAATYSVIAPKGQGRINNMSSPRETVNLNEDGTWIINVNINRNTSFAPYTINFEIK